MSNVTEIKRGIGEKERLEKFAEAYADNGGDHIQAYIAAGFSEKTAAQNAKKYLDKNNDHVMAVVKRRMGQTSALAQKLLLTAATDESVPWNTRLKALEMILKNSGIQKDTLVIEDTKADEMTPEERQKEIQELMARYN
ncbi:hypothetical protein OLCHANIL_00246 [Vibrio phage V05]|nr:hypothetical protein OLCHANIL_00246 [Vibrio phage V05]